MIDDYDDQLAQWHGVVAAPVLSAAATPELPLSPVLSASPMPERMALRSSSSSLSPVPGLSPMRTHSPLDDRSADIDLCQSDQHIVHCSDYARDLQLQPPARSLVGVEPLQQMLANVIGRTLANPVLMPCEKPVMAVKCPTGSGARSAVHAWAAAGVPQRVAVLTYEFFNPDRETTVAFHMNLMRMAAALSPCILVVHRLLQRINHVDGIAKVTAAMWSAWLQMTKCRQSEWSAPPAFWLLFIDDVPMNLAASQWSWIPHVVALSGYTPMQLGEYLLCRMSHAIELRIASSEHVAMLMAWYRPMVDAFAAQHAHEFASVGDIVRFVADLFLLPLRDLTLTDLAEMRMHGVTPAAMPQASHFEQAMTEMLQQRAAVLGRIEENNRAAWQADQHRRTSPTPGHPPR